MGKKKRKNRYDKKQQTVQTVAHLHDEPELNEHQQEAVNTTEGPLLLIAGAGSGKTYTILRRIAHLIMDKHVSPYNILAVTFTNKAAAEMKEQLAQILGPTIAMPTVCTFHSFGAMAVNWFYDSIGYKKNISICDAHEWKKRIQEQAKKMGINEISALEYGAKISRWKDYLIRPEDLVPDEMEYGFEKDAAEFYLEYQKKLKKDNAMDFDDLIMKTVEALHDEKVLSYFQNRYLYITVDEYQDTSHAQFELMRLLADKNKNICVVGDDYQSIYAFRGADISNILDFQQVYPHSKKIVLGENYRSTQTIVNAAAAVIRNNTHQLDKNLVSMNDRGNPIHITYAADGKQECNLIAEEIEKLVFLGEAKYSDFAIMYRIRSLSRLVEESLRMRNIPYVIYNGVGFFSRREIMEMTSYLKLAAGYTDQESLERVINIPSRRIGDKTIKELLDRMDQYSDIADYMERFEQAASTFMSSKKFLSLMSFLDVWKKCRKASGEMMPGELVEYVCGLVKYDQVVVTYDSGKSLATGETRMDNVHELASHGNAFYASYKQEHPEADYSEVLLEYLNDLALMGDADTDEKGDCVRVMTMHVSKGLEFPYVYIIACENGLLPHRNAKLVEEVEEERRLFYVGSTRAKRQLSLSCANERWVNGRIISNPPSPFLDELPDEYVSVRTFSSECEDDMSLIF